MKKGFTLTELLGIITILSIIALIAVPQVFNIIDASKEKSESIDIEMLLKSVSNEIYSKQTKNLGLDINYCEVFQRTVTCDGEKLFSIDKDIIGYLYISNNEVEKYSLIYNNKDYSKNINYTDSRCFNYEVHGDKIAIIDYYESENNYNPDIPNLICSKDVVIPPMIEEKPVTYIGSETSSGIYASSHTGYGFDLLGITSVIIPPTVVEIGHHSFEKNDLVNVVIPDSVTIIGSGAFQDNQLKNVVISNNLQIIDDDLFLNNQLTKVKIPNRVTEIGYGAFQDNQLAEVEIPDSVKTIYRQAFQNNRLTYVRIHRNEGNLNLSGTGLDTATTIEWNE